MKVGAAGGERIFVAWKKEDFSVSGSEIDDENGSTNKFEVFDAFLDNVFDNNSKIDTEQMQTKINEIIAEQ